MGLGYCKGGNPKSESNTIIIPVSSNAELEYLEKWCWQCRKYLPLDEFNKNKSRPDGLGAECRECANASYNKWKLRNEKI